MNNLLLFNKIRNIVKEEILNFSKDKDNKEVYKKEKSEEGSEESKSKGSDKSDSKDTEDIKYEDLPKITPSNAIKIKILKMNGSSGVIQLDNKVCELLSKKQVIAFLTDWMPALSAET